MHDSDLFPYTGNSSVTSMCECLKSKGMIYITLYDTLYCIVNVIEAACSWYSNYVLS